MSHTNSFSYTVSQPVPYSQAPSSRRAMRRKHSPSRVTTQTHIHSNSHIHLHSTKYQPSDDAEALSRILDPSYVPPVVTTSQPSVFIDKSGDLHDPDFRHFPSLVQLQDRRRSWERDQGARRNVVDDDDDEPIPDPFSPKSPTHRSRSSTVSTAPYAFFPSYIPSTSTSPASADTVLEEEEEYSPFEEQEVPERSTVAQRILSKGRRRSIEEERPEQLDESEQIADPRDPLNPRRPGSPGSMHDNRDTTPTCGDALRTQYHAIALAIRFGIFRTKRRLKRKLSVTG